MSTLFTRFKYANYIILYIKLYYTSLIRENPYHETGLRGDSRNKDHE